MKRVPRAAGTDAEVGWTVSPEVLCAIERILAEAHGECPVLLDEIEDVVRAMIRIGYAEFTRGRQEVDK